MKSNRHPATKKDQTATAPAAEKTVALIEFLCGCSKPTGISEMAAALGTNKNMVYRIIRTLMRRGWVTQRQETQKYEMSLAIYHHGSKIAHRLDLKMASEESLLKLRDKTGQFTYLTVLDGGRAIHVRTLDAKEGSIRISAPEGATPPLHASSPGKVFLAHHPEVCAQVCRSPLPSFTEATLTNPVRLRKHLAEILKAGIALDREETARGLICVAAPIFNHEKRVIGAIGISTLTLFHSFDDMVEKFAPEVRIAASCISRALGHNPTTKESNP